jgi:hypothetical protein
MPSQITRQAVNLVDGQPDGSQKLESTARSLLILLTIRLANGNLSKNLIYFVGNDEDCGWIGICPKI